MSQANEKYFKTFEVKNVQIASRKMIFLCGGNNFLQKYLMFFNIVTKLFLTYHFS